MLRDGKNTVALTLLRAVGTIGDWTRSQMRNQLMQVKGDITLEYSVIPFDKNEKAEAYSEAYAFNADWIFAFETHRHNGSLPQNKKFIKLKGDYIRSSALKLAEDGNGTILRLYNVSEEN